MGIYDRPYARDPEPGFQLQPPRTATMQMVAICAIAYLAQIFVGEPFSNALELSADWFRRPWQVYQLLTYGFLHSTENVGHILINMLVLWMFGREIEQRYGRSEFLSFYLTAIVFAGLVWSLLERLMGSELQLLDPATGQVESRWPHILGASGGIAAIVALYALNFPHRQVLFMFFIPMPMWVAAAIGVLMDARGAVSRSGNVAFTAHLAGALFGLLYFKMGWSPGRWLVEKFNKLSTTRSPRLRVHQPDTAEDLSEQVDRILAKIQNQGQDSLTRAERKTLEKASRQYQQKRNN